MLAVSKGSPTIWTCYANTFVFIVQTIILIHDLQLIIKVACIAVFILLNPP